MSDQSIPNNVGELFSKKWWGNLPDHLEDLMGKLADRNYKLKPESAASASRSVLACEYVFNNVPKGGRVLDAACGIGQIAHCLGTRGYVTEAFDISEKAIERAKEIAVQIGQNPASFVVADENRFRSFADESFDAVIAMGYFRYLKPETHAKVYAEVRRILKPGGKFVVNFQNALFEMFSLNDGCLRFWADTIRSFSNAEQLLDGKDVLVALKEMIAVPEREFVSWSVSKNMPTVAENPLTYADVAKKHRFDLERILYALPHVLPPNLEKKVDPKALAALKDEIFLKRTEDWRSMFMEYEFMALLAKPR